MMGGLAQYLLHAGHDCLYSDCFDDEQLLGILTEENRILLSRDRELVRNAPENRAVYVDSTDPVEQFQSIVDQFDLKITEDTIFTRCPMCNTRTIPVSSSEVAENIPDQTRDWIEEYFRCPECGKVYWKGTHYQAIQKKFTRWNVLVEPKEDCS